MISFAVYGQPKGKARPRMCRNGHVYTPAETVSYEHRVQAAFLSVVGKVNPRDDLCRVVINAYFQAPKTIRKMRALIKETDYIACGTRPDCDNCGKIILDALNGLAWTDDARVWELTVRKWYSLTPRVVVDIEWEE